MTEDNINIELEEFLQAKFFLKGFIELHVDKDKPSFDFTIPTEKLKTIKDTIVHEKRSRKSGTRLF
jgi:hypothetical protein